MLQRLLSRQQFLSRLSASLSLDAEAEGASGSSASQTSLEVQPEQNPVDSSGRNPLRQVGTLSNRNPFRQEPSLVGILVTDCVVALLTEIAKVQL